MSERFIPHELESREDPRSSLYTRIKPEIVHHLANGDLSAFKEAERPLSAQIMQVDIAPTDDGRTRILAYPKNYLEANFLPENKTRKQWEEWDDKNHPVYEQNRLASQALLQAQAERRPIQQAFSLPGIRVAMGTIYQFYDETSSSTKMAIRVNNDWENNRYAGWGNTYSSLLKLVRQGRQPIWYRNKTIEEVIPGRQDPQTGEMNTLFPQNFFFRSNHADYKRKALQIEGSDPTSENIQNFETATFKEMSYQSGVDLSFDLSSLGDDRDYRLNDVSASLTPQGTLEVQTILQIPKPDQLHDPEFGSHIVVADVQSIAQWYYQTLQHGRSELDIDSVFDGATGQKDPKLIDHYRQNFLASPPLETVTRDLYHYHDQLLN